MAVVTTCRACGRAFEASTADVKAGPAVWRYCPACRKEQRRG
jgi:hypothetical protein